MPSNKLVFIALLSRSSYTRKFTRKHDCSRACLALAGELFSAKIEPKKAKKFYNFRIPEKKLTCWPQVSKKKKKTEVAWKWAFGPCGKFEITNTGGDQVDLIPGDIPGAGFSEEEREKWLNFWLKWRRINQNGNKKELLETRKCTSSGFARSISCLCCLFSTKSLHGCLDTCFHTKFVFSGSRTWKQGKSKNIWPWPREDLHYIKQS